MGASGQRLKRGGGGEQGGEVGQPGVALGQGGRRLGGGGVAGAALQRVDGQLVEMADKAHGAKLTDGLHLAKRGCHLAAG